MSEPRKVPPRGKAIPDGIKEGVMNELALSPVNGKERLTTIADRYDIAYTTVCKIQQYKRFEIQNLRDMLSEQAMVGSLLATQRVQEDLLDDEKMAETPMKDKAAAVKMLTDASMSALEGNRPALAVPFDQVKGVVAYLAEYDAKCEAERQAKARAIDI